MPVLKEDYKLCAAMDFGTTYCGVVCSLKEDPTDMWLRAQNKGDTFLQEPTTVLLTPERDFHKFGTDAEAEYKSLVFRNEHKDYFLFRRFKMSLHSERELTAYAEIEDISGKKYNAMKIFTMAIAHLKSKMREKINSSPYKSIKDQEIRWVITVPAIWTEAAKQLMRVAANKAGISDSQLLLGLEPEVAAIHCKENYVNQGPTALVIFDPGSKYMVLDLGGGTVDITLQEVLKDGHLMELKAASGGSWGGVGIDAEFLTFLQKIFGIEVIHQFKTENVIAYSTIVEQFEKDKRSGNAIIIPIPEQLRTKYETASKKSLSQVLDKSAFSNKVHIKDNNLELTKDLMKDFFKNTLDKITRHVGSIFKQPEAQGVEYILMVGGFSESLIVQEEIRKQFSNKKVMIPHDAGSAVLKGAVLYGHNPNIISARVCPFTYGLHTRKPYDPKIHPKEKMKVINGREIVDGAFDKHLEKGQTVYIATPHKEHNFYVTDTSNPKVFWNVYRSSKENHIFCDEAGCEKIGRLEVILTNRRSSAKREFGVRMICRGTELEAEAIDKTTDETVQVRFNFLQLD